MKKFVVISHTHWDREWYMPFEVFRLRLVDLVDRLLGIVEKQPDFIFHLDAQAVVLEDYLEIRPENEEKLKKYITNGNIIVGPWYLQSDFYLTSGESTIRNLQKGIGIARKFGSKSMVGHAPDQFGNISQLPQILNGFGIDSFIFGRGYYPYADKDGNPYPVEFIWRAPDGSESIAICMRSWYNNAQRIPAETEYAKLLLDINEKTFGPINVTPYILLMNGVDHLEAQDDILQIISNLRAEGIDIEQTTLDNYISNVKDYIKQNKCEMSVYEGALLQGNDQNLLKGCWSSRIYLKQANVAAQDMIESKLEPLWSYLYFGGAVKNYPYGEFNYIWKNMMKNHPHDSICGCSRDEVHAHMEDSYARIKEVSDEMLRRGMSALSAHVESRYRDDKNYMVTVFNSTERVISDVVRVRLDFIESENVESFSIKNEKGEDIAYTVISKSKTRRDVFSPLNLPGFLDVDRYEIEFMSDRTEPFSASVYSVIPGEEGTFYFNDESHNSIENDFYNISFDNGVKIYSKKTNKEYNDAIIFEDVAEAGDSYMYRRGSESEFYSAVGSSVEESTHLTKKIKFYYTLDIPAYYDFEKRMRSEKTEKTDIEVVLTLKEGSDVIGISYSFENKSEDHRLRLKLNIEGNELITDSPFDYSISDDSRRPHFEYLTSNHATSFALFVGNQNSAAIYHKGNYEYDVSDGGIAVTVLRASGWINRRSIDLLPAGGEQWRVPGNQVLRDISGEIALNLNATKDPYDSYIKAKQYRIGLLSYADSFDTKKYAGGRYAVQKSELARFYYIDDPCKDIYVSGSLLKLEGENISVSCIKHRENGGLVVRLSNFSNESNTAKIICDADIYESDLMEIKESYLAFTKAALGFRPKEIKTLILKK